MSRISVVVPIYKPGNILKYTLNSIANQSFTDFECILVDDGSNEEKTNSICKNFVSLDKRFKYFEKENEGIEKTRLYGVDKSKSALLIFCDHDDYYELDAFEKLYSAYVNSDADIISANCYSQRIGRNILTRKRNNLGIDRDLILNHEEFIKTHFLNFFGIHSFSVSTWGKLYKKELFRESLDLFNVNILEDVVINIQLFERAKKIHFISDFVYTHVYGGLSSTFDVYSAINGYAKIFIFRKNYLNKYTLEIKPLLIEYRNIINQRVNLMIDNQYTVQQFEMLIKKVQTHEIFEDLLLFLDQAERGSYINFISKDDAAGLYLESSSKNTIIRKVKHKIKKIIIFLHRK